MTNELKVCNHNRGERGGGGEGVGKRRSLGEERKEDFEIVFDFVSSV